MFEWLKRLFSRPTEFRCGGTGFFNLVDRLGRTVGRVYYRRPTSSEKRNYLYERMKTVASEKDIKEIAASENKEAKIHDTVVEKISVPFCEKVFVRIEGKLFAPDGKKIDTLSPPEQFKILVEYFDHILIQVVDEAYSAEGTLKKKS